MHSRLDTSRTLTSRLSYAASVVMLLAYDDLPNGPNDPDIEAVNDCLYRIGFNMRPGVWMVDYWPFLRYAGPPFYSVRIAHHITLGTFRDTSMNSRTDTPRSSTCSRGNYLKSGTGWSVSVPALVHIYTHDTLGKGGRNCQLLW